MQETLRDDYPGLSEQEAQKKLTETGYNELPSSKPRTIWLIVYEVIKEPMFLLLVACGVLYLILGDFQEAVMLLGFVFVIMGITFYQERKTERALDALKDLSSPRALVIRDGEHKRIPGRDVVVGDLIILAEGDRVPADSAIIKTNGFSVDESLLTGESVPVRKRVWDRKEQCGQPGGEDLPFIFSGTLVVQGQAKAYVLAIGSQTELGKIGKELSGVKEEETRLKIETRKLVKTIALVGLGLCILVVVLYGITRGNWIQAFLTGITLAMAILPEEFPVVMTVFLALGAWRMSKKNVLTRKVTAIETLGTATVLCTDKTGTLTYNRMAVKQLFTEHHYVDIMSETTVEYTADLQNLMKTNALACKQNPFDPMERAIINSNKLINGEEPTKLELKREYPISSDLLAMGNLWHDKEADKYIVAVKGSPEAIMKLCHLPDDNIQIIEKQLITMASDGLRVLGTAVAEIEESMVREQLSEYSFTFSGLIGLADPPRDTVPAAVKECYQAGMRIIMITGDYPGTAQAIGRDIGLKNPENIITGPELNLLSDEELTARIGEVSIFARMVPEQKLRIVMALKARGDIVAMTGDGVNDAPALKASHIGIAMGERGTDVAREASSLVLLKDDFSSIVSAVRMGRRIYDNLQKASAYIFSIHVPIAGLSLIPVLAFDLPIIFWPVHVVFLELIIDPACSIVFEMEKEEENIMQRPPRDIKQSMFNFKMVTVSILQGVSVLLIVGLVYFLGLSKLSNPDEVRAFTFTTLVFSNIGLIITNRSWTQNIFQILRKPNPAMVWLVAGVIILVLLVTKLPYLNKLFHFAPLHAWDLGICFLAGLLSIFWFEILKYIKRCRIRIKGSNQ